MHHLFPVPVARVHLGPLPDDEAGALVDLAAGYVDNVGNLTSVRRTALHDPRFARLRGQIDEALTAYLAATIAPGANTRFSITQSWLNVTTKGQWHHRHHHQNSIISGVYYAEADGEDRIMFHRSGVTVLQFPPTSWNPYNSDSWWLPVSTGDLLLFPSTLEHSVPNVQTDTRRVSLSFNTWFSGEAGAVGNLTHLAATVTDPYAL